MKKLLLLAILSFSCIAKLSAQESKFVGTWIGNYSTQIIDDADEDYIWVNVKLYIRIYQYEQYRLKIKAVPDNSCSKCKVLYYNNCVVTNIGDNYIDFYWKDGKSYDYAYDGETITGMLELEDHYRLLYTNGAIQINPIKRIMIDYDKNGNFIGRKDVSHISAWIWKGVELFKDEADW